MIIRKIIDPVFIFFSKMYIYIYEDRRDYWIIFPSVILSFLFITNLEILSFYIIDIPGYYYLFLGVFFIVLFVQLYVNMKYEYVKNYKMSKKTKTIITMLIIIDLVINFICLNISRNGKFMW